MKALQLPIFAEGDRTKFTTQKVDQWIPVV